MAPRTRTKAGYTIFIFPRLFHTPPDDSDDSYAVEAFLCVCVRLLINACHVHGGGNKNGNKNSERLVDRSTQQR